MKRLIFTKRRGSLLTSSYTHTSPIANVTQPSLSRTALIPQFDSSLGTLFKIQIELATTARSTSRIENLDAIARPSTQSGVNFIEVASLNGVALVTNNIQVLFSNNLAAYDGVPDYGGSSGVSNARRTSTNTKSNFIHTSFNSFFIGGGNVTLDIVDVATGFAVGPADYILAVVPEAGASVTVTYYYITPPVIIVISGYVWEDYNANGVLEPGEPGIQGITLNLLDEFGSSLGISTTTDINGYYELEAPGDGNYYVSYNPSTYTPTYDLDGIDGSNSFFVTVAGSTLTDQNIGLVTV